MNSATHPLEVDWSSIFYYRPNPFGTQEFLASSPYLWLPRATKGYTVMRNQGMNQNFDDINPEQDFQPFDDEKNSHPQTKISWSKTTWNQKKIKIWSEFEPALV